MTPRLLHKLSNKFITTISVGAECSVAMDSSGLVYVWGRADSGQVSESENNWNDFLARLICCYLFSFQNY